MVDGPFATLHATINEINLDAQKVKGLAPLACKTDRIDAWVLAERPAATWSPRSGYPPLGSGPDENAPDGDCTWSATAPRSSTASTPRC